LLCIHKNKNANAIFNITDSWIFVFIFGIGGLHRRFWYRQRIRVYNNIYNESREKKYCLLRKYCFDKVSRPGGFAGDCGGVYTE
jgi:hypothetical protein